MFGEKVVVLLTGRGNNTLENKNVRPINGNPLLSYPANEAKKISGDVSYFASSENSEILEEAQKCGYIPIRRPDEYARPDSQHVDCLVHALGVIKDEYKIDPDILVVLLANCVTTKLDWINDCIRLIHTDPTASSVVPVQKNNDHHPYRAKKIVDGYISPFVDLGEKEISSNRQDLESNYYLCHNFWVLNLKNSHPLFLDGQEPWTYLGNKIIPYVVDYSIDVHTEEDIILSGLWLDNNK